MRRAFFLATFLILCFFVGPASAAETGHCVSIVDGDTIKVRLGTCVEPVGMRGFR